MNNQTSSMESPLPTPVSWQVAFWQLAPLAISCMAQPAGQVMRSRSLYKIYLRSSPIFCALDAVAFLLRLAVSPWILGLPLQQATAMTIKDRYRTPHGEKSIADSHSIEPWYLLRGFFFVLGTLPPAVKLAAMEGVPWTKAWGMMFLFSFVVFEFMALFIKYAAPEIMDFQTLNPVDEEVNTQLLGHQPNFYYSKVPLPPPPPRFFGGMIENCCYNTATTLHTFLLLWSVADMWTLRASDYPSIKVDSGNALVGIYPFATGFFRFSMIIVLFSFGYTLALPALSSIGKIKNGIQRNGRRLSIVEALGLTVVIFAGGVLLFHVVYIWGSELWEEGNTLIDVPLSLLTLCGPMFFAVLMEVLSKRSPAFARMLLLEDKDMRSHLTLTFFLVNVIVCLMWYALRFDPEGTVNPAWTSIFG